MGAMLYARTIGARRALGWTMGILISILGMYFSVPFDLPTGSTIVCTLGLVLIMMAAVRPLIQGVVAQTLEARSRGVVPFGAPGVGRSGVRRVLDAAPPFFGRHGRLR